MFNFIKENKQGLIFSSMLIGLLGVSAVGSYYNAGHLENTGHAGYITSNYMTYGYAVPPIGSRSIQEE